MEIKKISLIIVMFFIVISCQDREPDPLVIPDAIKPRLEELSNSGECHGCTVQQSIYNDEYYYHLYCSYWSCSHCEVYHHDGTLVEWSEEFTLSEWLENRHQMVILWECGDELE